MCYQRAMFRRAPSSVWLLPMDFQATRFDPPARMSLQTYAEPPAVSNALEVELEIVRGRARHTRRHVVGKVFLIGSACDCDLVLGDEQFPDAYAYLFVQNDEVTLRHLGAGPAVHVGGKLVQAARLRHGDVLECGPYAFRICIRSREPINDDGNRPIVPAPHFAKSPSWEEAAEVGAAEGVVDLRLAREQVARLLSDIAAALRAEQAKPKVYEGGKPSVPGPSLAERVRRRASA
jgi:hypothetical protein